MLTFSHIYIIILTAHCISYSLHGSWIEWLKAINGWKLSALTPLTSIEFKQGLFWSLYPHKILKAEENYANSSFIGENEKMKS